MRWGPACKMCLGHLGLVLSSTSSRMVSLGAQAAATQPFIHLQMWLATQTTTHVPLSPGLLPLPSARPARQLLPQLLRLPPRPAQILIQSLLLPQAQATQAAARAQTMTEH
eukprot:15445491-Alexandrium_andersonii.AAC.1